MRPLVMLMIPLVLLGACASTSTAKREQLKQEIVEELRAEQLKQPSAPAPTVVSEVPTGSVEGRFLWLGAPLEGCRVRLVMVEAHGGAFGSRYTPTASIETQTGADGVYRFENVPPGHYKIKWALPRGDSWIRFLSPEPDLTIEPGATVHFRDIESARSVLGG